MMTLVTKTWSAFKDAGAATIADTASAPVIAVRERNFFILAPLVSPDLAFLLGLIEFLDATVHDPERTAVCVTDIGRVARTRVPAIVCRLLRRRITTPFRRRGCHFEIVDTIKDLPMVGQAKAGRDTAPTSPDHYNLGDL